MSEQRRSTSTKQSGEKDMRRFLEEHKDKLSDSTLRAKLITSTDEHQDKPGQTLATQSHEVIQQWASERKAEPSTVPGTEHDGRPGVLRFDFPGYGGDKLEHISWDRWFETFDARQLIFVYQEEKADG